MAGTRRQKSTTAQLTRCLFPKCFLEATCYIFRVIKILSCATFPNNTLIMKMTQVRSEYKASFDA